MTAGVEKTSSVHLLCSCLKFCCWYCTKTLGKKQRENSSLQSFSNNVTVWPFSLWWSPIPPCQTAAEVSSQNLTPFPPYPIPRVLPMLCREGSVDVITSLEAVQKTWTEGSQVGATLAYYSIILIKKNLLIHTTKVHHHPWRITGSREFLKCSNRLKLAVRGSNNRVLASLIIRESLCKIQMLFP